MIVSINDTALQHYHYAECLFYLLLCWMSLYWVSFWSIVTLMHCAVCVFTKYLRTISGSPLKYWCHFNNGHFCSKQGQTSTKRAKHGPTWPTWLCACDALMLLWSKTAQLKVENSVQTTFRLSPQFKAITSNVCREKASLLSFVYIFGQVTCQCC